MCAMRLLLFFLLVSMGMAGPGRAGTLTYSSESIIEFDLFHQWSQSGGLLWVLPSHPAAASAATLRLDFAGSFEDMSRYTLKRSGAAQPGHQLINDFTLSVTTAQGSYEIEEHFYRDFEIIVETGAGGRVADWEISWDFGASDYFRMTGAGGVDQVSWHSEYLQYPEQYDDLGYPWSARGQGSFRGGQLDLVVQSQRVLPSMPLPVPLIFVFSGLAALFAARRWF